MNVDFLTLACLRDRLDGLLGARVQRIVAPDDLSVGMELYAKERFHLLASAHPQHARVLLMPERLRRGTESASPLLLLLRKWVHGAHLVDVTQPPWERILMLHFDGAAGACRLVIEVIGRYSNVILVGPDGNVLEAIKRIGPHLNRYRVTLPAHPYQLPPPPAGRPPDTLTAYGLGAMLANADPDQPLHTVLVRQLLAVGPVAAREIAARAAGHPEARVADAAPDAVAAAIAGLFAPIESGEWAPHVALDQDGEVAAFTAYEPRQFERVEAVADISTAMQRYFEIRLAADPYAAARRRVGDTLNDALARVERALHQVRSQRVDEAAIQRLRETGELLLTYQHQVPRRADSVALVDYEGQPRQIALDPALTAVQNAQAYFHRYEKAQRAGEQVTRRTHELSADRAYLDQLAADLALAESRPDIDAVHEALAEAGWAQKKRSSSRPEGPRSFEVGGFTLLVGRNARQNEELTFHQAAPTDLWLHARGVPGAHVIVRRGQQDVPEEVVGQAAALAVYYSPARGDRAPVDVVERRFVRSVPGRPGLVTYRNERTVLAEGRLPADLLPK